MAGSARLLRYWLDSVAEDAQVLGVLVDAQKQLLALGIWPLRAGWGCVELTLIPAMSVGLHRDNGVGVFIRHLKLPPVAALANTHAILGRSAAVQRS